MAANIKMLRGTADAYTKLEAKNADALYFLTDTGKLYLGTTPIASEVIAGTRPTSGATGKVYIEGSSVYIWNGTQYIGLNNPSLLQTLADDTTDTGKAPTAKAVVDYVKSSVKAGTADLTDIKTRLKTVEDGKADKGTTLAGYGIADAYTKTETDGKITAAVANAGHLTRQIVDKLPAVAGAKDNVIYMVPKAGGSGDQQYDEYMLVVNGENKSLEKIGDSTVNLSGYATTAYVDGKVNPVSTKADANAAAITKLNGNATVDGSVAKQVAGGVTNAVNQAKTYSDGLAKNYATAAQGAKADTALQESSITTGSANGTIAVGGTDVAVKGLGSAAYAAQSSFDKAGSADTALTNAKAYADGLMAWGTF